MLDQAARPDVGEPNKTAGTVDKRMAADERAAARKLTELEVRALAASPPGGA